MAMSNKQMRIAAYCSFSALFFIIAYAIMRYAYWALMSYHEQYQLFLFTRDYFAERITDAGGLADYVGEFLTQFYYVPWMGAIAAALLLTSVQIAFGACLLQSRMSLQWRMIWYALSAVPSAMLLAAMSDENMLLSFPAALLITLLAVLALLALKASRVWTNILALSAGFALAYWLAGPAALVGLAIAIILKKELRHKWLWLLAALTVASVAIFILARTLYVQYPESVLFLGLNYFRIPETPISYFCICAAMIIIALLPNFKNSAQTAERRTLGFGAMGIVLLATALAAVWGIDSNKMQALKYDALVRHEKWHQIIKMAEAKAPTNQFCQQALNLALGKTGQLGDRMFEFPQNGIGSLLGKYELNNTSCLITAEAFYHLGMVNSAFRYNFDLQEAIMNNRKSGRFHKHLAECLIVNGKYEAAAKYLNKLQHSLFYSKWAKNATAYLNDEEKINRHPVWGVMRQNRYQNEMLYDYPEIEKMLALLALQPDSRNRLAWDYFNAAVLLKGDLKMFTGMYHYAPELFGIQSIPKNHQEAIAMFWTFGHPNFDGIPFRIDDSVKSRLANFVAAFSQDQNLSAPWAQQFSDAYYVYFLNQSQQSQSAQAENAKASEREG